jgi:hypothetical protein
MCVDDFEFIFEPILHTIEHVLEVRFNCTNCRALLTPWERRLNYYRTTALLEPYPLDVEPANELALRPTDFDKLAI